MSPSRVNRTYWLAAFTVGALYAQGNASVPGAAQSPDWGTKTLEFKYLDPEQLRSLYPGRSYVMTANSALKMLTVNGPAQFLKEVEETGKRLDIAPSPIADFDVTFYLLATAAEAPSAPSLPSELASIGKELAASAGAPQFKLADSQVFRLREGQPGEISFAESPANTTALKRVRIQSAFVSHDTLESKRNLISLNRMQCWLSRSTPPQAAAPLAPTSHEGDITASIDVEGNQPVVVARAGTDKPLVLVVRATVAR